MGEKNENVFVTSKEKPYKMDSQNQNSKLFTFVSKDVTPFKVANEPEQSKKSFLVPYLIIDHDSMNI